MQSKGPVVPPQSRDWGPPHEGAPRTMLSAVIGQRPPTHALQSSYHLPRPLSANLHASYHRILRGLRIRGDDPKGAFALAIHLL